MALPNSGVLVTPGSGASLAAHSISSKQYEVWMLADAYGHLRQSAGRWVGSQAGAIFPTGDHNLCALWNGAGSGVALEVIGYHASFADTVGGDTSDTKNFPRLYRITAAPSAGTTRTPVKTRSAMSALPSQVLFYGEGVTATLTGAPFDFRWIHAASAHGHGLSEALSRPFNFVPRFGDVERAVLAEGEGVVVHGGDNPNVAESGQQALYFMVR